MTPDLNNDKEGKERRNQECEDNRTDEQVNKKIMKDYVMFDALIH